MGSTHIQQQSTTTAPTSIYDVIRPLDHVGRGSLSFSVSSFHYHVWLLANQTHSPPPMRGNRLRLTPSEVPDWAGCSEAGLREMPHCPTNMVGGMGNKKETEETGDGEEGEGAEGAEKEGREGSVGVKTHTRT